MYMDETYIDRALALAARGIGAVEPNPMVGAVVAAADGRIVGEGWHRRFGDAHAEVNAFAEAGERARGGTLYVSLEPCCHFGKTPPCTTAVIASGVRRVVVAMLDPFPQVAGGGVAILREAGIEVVVGIREAEARALNAPFLKRIATGMPWVHLKWAMSLDGKIATRTGDSQWISGVESRAVVHELRGRMDAILVGRGTVVADDPLLTARPAGPRVATRVIISASGELPAACQLRTTAREIPTLIFTENESQLIGWKDDGCEIVGLQISLDAILRELGRRDMTNVLVEGGAGLLGSFLDASLGDEVHAFIAPMLIGGRSAPSPIQGEGMPTLAKARRLIPIHTRSCGPDTYVQARLQANGATP